MRQTTWGILQTMDSIRHRKPNLDLTKEKEECQQGRRESRRPPQACAASLCLSLDEKALNQGSAPLEALPEVVRGAPSGEAPLSWAMYA